jgi:hypothetical protein
MFPNCRETETNSTKLHLDESSRTSLTGLSVLMCNATFIFTPMNTVRESLGTALFPIQAAFFIGAGYII